MEIRAKSKYDFESVKALTHLMFYKKSDPKKSLVLKLSLVLFFLTVIIIETIVFKVYFLLIIVSFVNVFWIFMELYFYFILPKTRYKSLERMQGAENEYIFGDNALKVFTKSNEYNGESKIEYSLFVNVYETSKYFFLFQTENQAYIIDKSTIEGGTEEDIKNKLMSFVGDKFIVCKY